MYYYIFKNLENDTARQSDTLKALQYSKRLRLESILLYLLCLFVFFINNDASYTECINWNKLFSKYYPYSKNVSLRDRRVFSNLPVPIKSISLVKVIEEQCSSTEEKTVM